MIERWLYVGKVWVAVFLVALLCVAGCGQCMEGANTFQSCTNNCLSYVAPEQRQRACVVGCYDTYATVASGCWKLGERKAEPPRWTRVEPECETQPDGWSVCTVPGEWNEWTNR